MSAETASKRPLTQLNREIEELEADVSRLESERAAVAKDATHAARRQRYLQIARWIREPAKSFEFWPAAALMVGPAVVGVLVFIVVHLIVGSFPLALLGLVLGIAGGAAMFVALLYRPPDALLPAAMAEAESQSRLANARLKEKSERIAETKTGLQKLIDERRDQVASGKLQRAALLQRNWKGMREREWEDFVVEVLRTHGATVERTGHTGDQDANLVVDYGARRVAVMTQGEGHNISSKTIQHALAGRDRHRCDTCAVVINRRFTGAAQDFAQRNGCAAIGVTEFPDFVLGKIEL
jgi:HJR/Mrr/RecB family endonuclease